MLLDGFDKLGRESTPGPKLEGWAKGAGFSNIGRTVLKYPLGLWPKDKHFVSFPIALHCVIERVYCWKRGSLKLRKRLIRRAI